MQHKIVKVQNKNNDWKVVDIEMSPGGDVLRGVSVNRTNKKGEIFPNFDSITEGGMTDGELWESGSSKWYLFAPKQKPARSPGASPASITKAQDHKAELIKDAQDRKEESILRAGAFRDATLMTLEMSRRDEFGYDSTTLKRIWTEWVQFFLGKGNEPFI